MTFLLPYAIRIMSLTLCIEPARPTVCSQIQCVRPYLSAQKSELMLCCDRLGPDSTEPSGSV